MADVSIGDGTLVIELTVPERVLSLHDGSISVPLPHIAKAIAVADVMKHLRGTRMPGAGMPGRMAIGTWRGDQAGRSFLDFVVAHRPGPGVVLTLQGGEFDRILLALPRPDELVDQLT